MFNAEYADFFYEGNEDYSMFNTTDYLDRVTKSKEVLSGVSCDNTEKLLMEE